MVDKKTVYLYRLNRDSGKMDCIPVELYIFSNGKDEDAFNVISFNTEQTALFLPRGYLYGVDEEDIVGIRCFGDDSYYIFWCRKQNNEKAQKILDEYMLGMRDKYLEWVRKEEDTIKKAYYEREYNA